MDACRVLALSKKETPNVRVKQTYKWLLEYEEDLAGWREQYDLVHKTIERVRLHGLNEGTQEALEKEWGTVSERTGTKMTMGHMKAYVVLL